MCQDLDTSKKDALFFSLKFYRKRRQNRYGKTSKKKRVAFLGVLSLDTPEKAAHSFFEVLPRIDNPCVGIATQATKWLGQNPKVYLYQTYAKPKVYLYQTYAKHVADEIL